MTQLIRWDPFREMMAWRSALERVFDDSLTMSRTWDQGSWELALDVAEEEDAFVVKASIPGIKPEDMDISLTDNLLTIKGETKVEQEFEKAQYHVRERRFGSFQRSVALPTAVNANAVDASYENGVLTLRVPKADEVKPHKISIRRGNMIEGQSTKVK